MIDIKTIAQNPERIQNLLQRRDPNIDLSEILRLYSQKREAQRVYESQLSLLNGVSKDISKLEKDSPEFLSAIEDARGLREKIKPLVETFEFLSGTLDEKLLELPNIVLEAVPVSQRKEDKQIVHHWGEKPQFDYEILDHVALSEKHGLIDFKRGAKIAGSGFPLYRGKGAVLEWALINFMIDNAREAEFEFILPPILNNTQSLITTGNLPKFSEEIYSLQRDELHLIPTAETPITNLYRDEVLDGEDLPVRIAAYTPCFRREAGAAGKMTRGLMRLHQFNKLETYSICTPEQSHSEHRALIDNGERILKELGLHFRLANLPSCDLAQQSSQTYDIEIWLPKLRDYSEVSSASNCLDYQARRANIRYKDSSGKNFATTLNCSALATPRIMISLLESNQCEDGHIEIPKCLIKYTGFSKI